MKALNLVNKKFGRLLVLSKSHRKNNKVMWECVCDCGKTTYVSTYYLTSGKIRSCGCLKSELITQKNTTHNQRNTKLYNVWKSLKQRCCNSNDIAYKNYGGRGIKVCEEWLNDFQTFYDWAYSNGYKIGLTIDRINVNGDYEPTNCRWTDRQTQANNTRVNHLITYNGKTDTLANWARITGLSYGTLLGRLNNHHWSIEKALTTPPKNRH